MLELSLKSLRYKLAAKPTLRNINLVVKEGEFVWITGRSGAGKTTLGRVAAGLVPSWFSAEVNGEVKLDDIDLIDSVMKTTLNEIGYVSEDPTDQLSYITSTVEQEISLALYSIGFSEEERNMRVEGALAVCGLTSVRHREPRELSGGMKGRLVLAGEIAKRPKLYVVDEGLGHIDRGALKDFLEFLSAETKKGVSVIVLSNDLTLGSMYARHVVLMEDGTIGFQGDLNAALDEKKVIAATGGNKVLNAFAAFRGSNKERRPLSLSDLMTLKQ